MYHAYLESSTTWFSKKISWIFKISWPLNFGDHRLYNPRFGNIELSAFWVGSTVVIAWKPIQDDLPLPTADLVKSIFHRNELVDKLVFVDKSGNTTRFTKP